MSFVDFSWITNWFKTPDLLGAGILFLIFFVFLLSVAVCRSPKHWVTLMLINTSIISGFGMFKYEGLYLVYITILWLAFTFSIITIGGVYSVVNSAYSYTKELAPSKFGDRKAEEKILKDKKEEEKLRLRNSLFRKKDKDIKNFFDREINKQLSNKENKTYSKWKENERGRLELDKKIEFEKLMKDLPSKYNLSKKEAAVLQASKGNIIMDIINNSNKYSKPINTNTKSILSKVNESVNEYHTNKKIFFNRQSFSEYKLKGAKKPMTAMGERLKNAILNESFKLKRKLTDNEVERLYNKVWSKK